MGKKVMIVIGERMGKGNHVADGIIKAGGDAYVIPGMAADMKLGDVMKEKTRTWASASAAAAVRVR